MKTALYPLKFQPILKERIWGGSKLKTDFGKPTSAETVGESWEISDVEGDISVVANGTLEGMSLKSCLEHYKEALIGRKN